RRAIETLLSRSRDPEYRNHLETALIVLDDFVPDEEVPLDEEENTRKWLTSRNRPFASSGSANHMKGNSPMSEENGPIFQVPSQAVEMKVAIHFYKERKASILLNVDSTGAARNFCEVQFFAFYLLRQLTTLDNPADDMLAYIMANTSTLDIRQIASD